MHTSRTKKKHTWWILTLLIVTFSCVDVALGAGRVEYTPLVGLPGAQGTGAGGLVGYFNRLYMLVVAVGAIIAFLKIAFAGVKYSLDGVVTHKQEAKDDIKGALFGLVILLVPFIILNTIYGGLTKLNVLDVASRLSVSPPSTGTQGTTTGTGGVPINGTPEAPLPPPRQVTKNFTQSQLECSRTSNAPTNEFEAASGGTWFCAQTRARAYCTCLGGTYTQTGLDTNTGIASASCSYMTIEMPSTAADSLNGTQQIDEACVL